MTPIARFHLRSATVYALAAMAMGIAMAASQDFRLATAHSHLLLLGWVTTFLAGLFQMARPPARGEMLAMLHLVASHLGLVVLVAGVAFLRLGVPGGELFASLGAVITALGMLTFMAMVFAATREAAPRRAMAR